MVNIKARISLTNFIGLCLGIFLLFMGGIIFGLLGAACIVGVASSLKDVDEGTEAFIDIDTTKQES